MPKKVEREALFAEQGAFAPPDSFVERANVSDEEITDWSHRPVRAGDFHD